MNSTVAVRSVLNRRLVGVVLVVATLTTAGCGVHSKGVNSAAPSPSAGTTASTSLRAPKTSGSAGKDGPTTTGAASATTSTTVRQGAPATTSRPGAPGTTAQPGSPTTPAPPMTKPTNGAWPAEIEDAFREQCTAAPGATVPICDCALRGLEATLSVTDLMGAGGSGSLSPEMEGKVTQIMTRCIADQKTY